MMRPNDRTKMVSDIPNIKTQNNNKNNIPEKNNTNTSVKSHKRKRENEVLENNNKKKRKTSKQDIGSIDTIHGQHIKKKNNINDEDTNNTKSDIFCIKHPFKEFVRNNKMKERIEKAILDTNLITTRAYQLIKLFALKRLEEKQMIYIPTINPMEFLNAVSYSERKSKPVIIRNEIKELSDIVNKSNPICRKELNYVLLEESISIETSM